MDLNRVPISFTFDDGRRNHVSAGARILAEFGLRGTFYMCPGVTRNGVYRWRRPKNHIIEVAAWHDIREAYKMGHEIGNHSHRHVIFTDAVKTRDAEELARNEIEHPAKVIRGMLGQDRFTFAWPCRRPERTLLPAVMEHHVGVRPRGLRGSYNAILSKRSYVKHLNAFADAVAEKRVWSTPIIHDMGDERGRLPEDVFREHLEYVVSKPELEVLPVVEVLSETRP